MHYHSVLDLKIKIAGIEYAKVFALDYWVPVSPEYWNVPSTVLDILKVHGLDYDVVGTIEKNKIQFRTEHDEIMAIEVFGA